MDIKPPRKSPIPKAPITTLPAPLLTATVSETKQQPMSTEQPQPPEPRKSSRMLWWVLVSLLVMVLVLLGAAGSYLRNISPVDKNDGARHLVVFQAGAGAGEIASILKEKDIIRDRTAFRAYVELTGVKSQLQAGMYKFSRSQSVAQIVEDLVQGKTDAFNVTILPGMTLPQIRKTLERAGFESDDIEAAFMKKYDHPLLASKPAGVNLEGYIFPETYQIDTATTVESLIVRSFDQFYMVLKENSLPEKLSAKKLTLHAAITLASIIQKEVKDSEDQRKVAQVFLKRLDMDIELGSDVTFMYAADLLGVPESVNLDSPYNTRRYKGLPPGAISNFNISAMQALADPANTDYLYFVAGDDGTTYFSKTVDEHEAYTKKYCTTLCQ